MIVKVVVKKLFFTAKHRDNEDREEEEEVE